MTSQIVPLRAQRSVRHVATYHCAKAGVGRMDHLAMLTHAFLVSRPRARTVDGHEVALPAQRR